VYIGTCTGGRDDNTVEQGGRELVRGQHQRSHRIFPRHLCTGGRAVAVNNNIYVCIYDIYHTMANTFDRTIREDVTDHSLSLSLSFFKYVIARKN